MVAEKLWRLPLSLYYVVETTLRSPFFTLKVSRAPSFGVPTISPKHVARGVIRDLHGPFENHVPNYEYVHVQDAIYLRGTPPIEEAVCSLRQPIYMPTSANI